SEDTPVPIDVTSNDKDIDADDAVDDATIAIVDAPAHGTAAIEDGEILYTPDADFNGSDEFTYTVKDSKGATSNEATVIVTVTDVNDAPDAVDDAVETDEDTAIEIAVLDNDT